MCLLFFTPLFLRLVPVAAIGGLRPVELPFQILFLADLALPELLALIPADFDLDKGLLSITKSYQRLKGRDVITDPKTPKSYLHHEMDRGAKEAEVKRIRIHDLRHSHVLLLVEMGFSALAIADRVGHESVDITYKYAHLFPSKQQEMAQKLDMERREG